jgi:hypothetical protein
VAINQVIAVAVAFAIGAGAGAAAITFTMQTTTTTTMACETPAQFQARQHFSSGRKDEPMTGGKQW